MNRCGLHVLPLCAYDESLRFACAAPLCLRRTVAVCMCCPFVLTANRCGLHVLPFVLTANRCGLHVLRPLVKRGHDLSEGALRGYKKLGPKRKTTKPTPRATVCHTCVLLCSRIHSCRHSVAMPVRVGVALIMQTVG